MAITLGGYRAGKAAKGPWWSAPGPPGVLRKCREMPTKSAVACPRHNLGNAAVLQLSDNANGGIQHLSNNGILWLREGHPDRKPWPCRLGVGHGANPPIPYKLLITETGNSNNHY